MVLKCIAIDDEPLALNLVKAYIHKNQALQLVQVFDDALSAIEFIKQHPVHLLFLDVQMPDITGLDLARNLDPAPMIIFTTAHKKFAYEGYELDAIDYLLKPFGYDRFNKAVTKALEYYAYKSSDQLKEEFIYVYSEYNQVKINVHDIEYIESLEDYVKIHLSSAKPVMTLMPLKKMLEKLPADRFQQIHRSYIVAIKKIKSFQSKKIELPSITLPVSDSFVEKVKLLKP